MSRGLRRGGRALSLPPPRAQWPGWCQVREVKSLVRGLRSAGRGGQVTSGCFLLPKALPFPYPLRFPRQPI